MYYYLMPIAIIFVVAISSDTHTGSPFASRQVNDIYTHMTKAERRAAIKIGGLWGLCLGVIPGAIGFIVGILFFKSALRGMTLCFGLLPLVALVLWKKWFPCISKWQKSFLASTEWAKSEGIEANDIKLFRWKQK